MDVSTNGHWSPDWLHVAFVDQNLFGLLTESLDLVLRKRVTLEESFDLLVQVLDVSEINFLSLCGLISRHLRI